MILAGLGLAAAGAGIACAAALHPKSPWGGPVHRLKSGGVALSFDDGPDPVWTPRVLDALDRAGLRASFFILGDGLQRFPTLVRACAEAGHRVEVHGATHQPAIFQRPGALSEELRQVALRIAELTGRPPRWYRPPYGARPWSRSSWSAHGLSLVTWSWSCGDWAGGEQPGRRLRPARMGDIVLLHDGATPESSARARTLEAIAHLAPLRPGPLEDPA